MHQQQQVVRTQRLTQQSSQQRFGFQHKDSSLWQAKISKHNKTPIKPAATHITRHSLLVRLTAISLHAKRVRGIIPDSLSLPVWMQSDTRSLLVRSEGVGRQDDIHQEPTRP